MKNSNLIILIKNLIVISVIMLRFNNIYAEKSINSP